VNPRERVLAALSNQEVDRPPIDFCGHNDSTIHAVAYKRLREYLGLPESEPAVANLVECVVYADEDLLVRFHSDTRAVYMPVRLPDLEKQTDGSHVITLSDRSRWIKPTGGYYYCLQESPLSGKLNSQTIAALPNPKISQEDLLALRSRALELKTQTDFAVVLSGFLIMPVTGTQIWRGFEQWSFDTIDNRTAWQAMLAAYMERTLAQAEDILDAVGDQIDVAYIIGDDMATQRGPWLNPAVYRQFIKPWHKTAMDFIRSKTAAKIVFHICGAAREFIPDLIDLGVDAINPVQTSASGMDPAALKLQFGHDLAFWGGVDSQKVLPFGTPGQVRAEVKRIQDALGPSGLVVGSCHNIQPDVPPQNVEALFQAAVQVPA
jgi:uroporphyrinogen decarboxylase